MKRLKESGGFRSRPYVCPADRATIGYGHNLEAHPSSIRARDAALADEVKAGGLKGAALVRRLPSLGMVWEKEHAEKRLEEDVLAVMDGLPARCPACRHLTNLAASAHAGRSEGPSPLPARGLPASQLKSGQPHPADLGLLHQDERGPRTF